MEISKNFDSFFRGQLVIGFIVLCLFLIYKRKYLNGLLGFSDHSINYVTEPKLEEEIIKKEESNKNSAPGFNKLRVGFFVPTQSGFMK